MRLLEVAKYIVYISTYYVCVCVCAFVSALEVGNVIWYTMPRGNWTNRGLFIRVDIE